MSNTTNDPTGWQQIRAGVEPIKCSRLVQWNAPELRFVAASENEFEPPSENQGNPVGWSQVHSEFGRLICWITFGVGSEYLAKGFCHINKPELFNTNFVQDKEVLKVPSKDADVQEWVKKIIAKREAQKLPD